VTIASAAVFAKASRIFHIITHSEVVTVELDDDAAPADDWAAVLASLDPVSKDNLTKLGVTKSFHQTDLFWFSRPKIMLHIMQFVVFVMSLNVALALLFRSTISTVSAIIMGLSCLLVVVLFQKVN
jgi:hypothetical protein